MMTVVVPSPTSSSWVRLSSIILFAAGWETSISLRIAWPSFVRTIPPIGSSSIFSMALGPRHDRMMSETLEDEPLASARAAHKQERTYVFAAVMLDNCARRPTCLSPALVSMARLAE